MLSRFTRRNRRATKTRAIIRASGRARVCIFRSLKHFGAQLIVPGDQGDRVLASASSLEKDVKTLSFSGNNTQLAEKIGELFGQRVLSLNIKEVAFDRSGRKYGKRLQAFKEAAEKVGVVF